MNAIKKYGIDGFRWDVIDTANTIDELNKKEVFYIKKYNSTNSNIGYNKRYGGSNSLFTEEAIQNMSKAQQGKTVSMEARIKISETLKGRKPTLDHRKKISAAKKGKKMSVEARKNMSEAQKGKLVGDKNPFYGKTHTEETKKKISEAKKGVKPSAETRKKMSEARFGAKSYQAKQVIQYTTDNIFVKKWDCIADATRAGYGKHIVSVCKGERGTAGGYKWEYAIK